MENRNLILAALTLLLLAFSYSINAQITQNVQQIKILGNYGFIPFEDGKTIITDVRYEGLDNDYHKYDEIIGKRIPLSKFELILKQYRAVISSGEKFRK